MNLFRSFEAAILASLIWASAAGGATMLIDDFNDGPASGWAFFTDGVMGGVSTGRAMLEREDQTAYLRLSGTVSTENNGGFIQARLQLPASVPEDATGLELRARGNGQRYFIHLRTRATVLPWQYYQAPFDVSADWSDLQIPFQSFTAQGSGLRRKLQPEDIQSIAVVAYGRDHNADVSVQRLGVYWAQNLKP